MFELAPAAEPALGDLSLYPELEHEAYFAWAAVAPWSALMRDTASEVFDAYARSGIGAVRTYVAQRERLRGLLAQLVHGEASEIALMPNTTRGVVDIALSIPWKRGERIVCFDGEFPTNVTPWQRAAQTFELELAFLPVAGFRDARGEALGRLEAELRRGARLVAVSAVQFQSGLRMPLSEMGALCARYGAELFVDSIQAVGALPLNPRALGVHYMANGGHKWLGGLEGTGFLWVAQECVPKLVPRTAGWLSHEHPFQFLFEGAGHLHYERPIRAKADYLETGVTNALGFACLEPSVATLLSLGVDRIYEHLQRLHQRLEEGLTPLGFVSQRGAPDARSGILSFAPPAQVDIVALPAELAKRGVIVTAPDGLLRFAPHWPTNESNVDAAIEGVRESLG